MDRLGQGFCDDVAKAYHVSVLNSEAATVERLLVDEAGYGRAPRICADAYGRVWVAWIAWNGTDERVRLCVREPNGRLGRSFDCGPPRPLVTDLALAQWHDGVIAAWIDGSDPDVDGLKLCAFDGTGAGEPQVLVVPWQNRPAQVALSASAGTVALAWTVRDRSGRSVWATFGEHTDALADPVSFAAGPEVRADPALAMVDGGAWVAWGEFDNRGGRVVARFVAIDGEIGEPVQVAGGAGGIASNPALCSSQQSGSWIAWQSDVDPKRGPGLVRWIEVAHLEPGPVLRFPQAPMPGIERQSRDQDQGFESPSLAAAGDGRLIVIGRGSQSINRQDLGANGWTDRVRVDDPGWSCRGRRYSIALTDEGVFIVGRERDGLAVRRLALGSLQNSGFPELASVTRDAKSTAKAASDRMAYEIHGHRVLFGDIHQHTAASDGTGSHAETFTRARYRYVDDLVAVADHESFLGKRTSPGDWEATCAWVRDFNDSGTFVALDAFEWTGKMHPGPGHKVVYLPEAGGPVLSRDDSAHADSAGLIAACREIGALVFPHHVGWTGADMEAHDPCVQCCFEIVSCHGAYERQGLGPISTRGDDKPGEFVGDALDAGLRFGLVGGSDGHGLNWHHGICRVGDSHRSGLTAVFAESVTRRAVLDALQARRCYATSGAKIGLWFEIDGRPMGSEIQVSGPVSYRVVVAGTSPLSAVSLVTNCGQELRLDSRRSEVDATGTLDSPTSWVYFYVRAVQDDGHMAWSSPIWIDRIDRR